MVRQNERSKIFIVKNENDIYDLLTQSNNLSPEHPFCISNNNNNQLCHLLGISMASSDIKENTCPIVQNTRRTDNNIHHHVAPECRINIDDDTQTCV